MAVVIKHGTLESEQRTRSRRGHRHLQVQIVRSHIDMSASVVGKPSRLLKPYINYPDSLRIRNTLRVGYGRAQQAGRHSTQGCPFCMTLMALLFTRWTVSSTDKESAPGWWQTICMVS